MLLYIIIAEQDKRVALHSHDISIGREGRGGEGNTRPAALGKTGLFCFIGCSSRTSFCGEMFCFLLPELHKDVCMFIRRTSTFCRVFSEQHVPSE